MGRAAGDPGDARSWAFGCPRARTMHMSERVYDTLLRVRRRCLVCEAIDEIEEPLEAEPIGHPCASCHAPTERIEIVQRRSRLRPRNAAAAVLGRLGGLKGGPARAAALTPEQRHEIALHAAHVRWHKL